MPPLPAGRYLARALRWVADAADRLARRLPGPDPDPVHSGPGIADPGAGEPGVGGPGADRPPEHWRAMVAARAPSLLTGEGLGRRAQPTDRRSVPARSVLPTPADPDPSVSDSGKGEPRPPVAAPDGRAAARHATRSPRPIVRLVDDPPDRPEHPAGTRLPTPTAPAARVRVRPAANVGAPGPAVAGHRHRPAPQRQRRRPVLPPPHRHRPPGRGRTGPPTPTGNTQQPTRCRSQSALPRGRRRPPPRRTVGPAARCRRTAATSPSPSQTPPRQPPPPQLLSQQTPTSTRQLGSTRQSASTRRQLRTTPLRLSRRSPQPRT